MQFASLLFTSAILSLSSASIIPRPRGLAHAATGTALLSAYGRRSPVDINAMIEPQSYADVQHDRRKAFGESL
ncbi:hypothetical protein RRF57_007274 [Xylaria bambusicola]|uniref:Uncharacterized protein n=1 Tax=Xylaria bambusicola TaxID=326684 RepID=A0AAN7UFX7_9PEZI